MSKETEHLLREIEEFLSETGMGPSYLGKRAIGNSDVVKRLRNGGRVWPENAEGLRAFMDHYRSFEPKHKAASNFRPPYREGARP